MKHRQLFQKPMLLASFLLISSFCFSQVTQQWVKRYHGPVNSYDIATSLAVDASGNVYVTGYSKSSGTNANDYATIKYNAAGAEVWVQRYTNAFGDKHAYAIVVDASENVYVTGTAGTVKYSATGNKLWVDQPFICSALAVDASGFVYVAGQSGYDYGTAKYDSAGNRLWVKTYNGFGGYQDFATALAVDASGNVYVTGGSHTEDGSSFDFATIKYNAAGKKLWVKRYNGPENNEDVATKLAVDATGNVYVTGWSYGSGTWADYATIKYDASGNEVWVKRYNGPGNENDFVQSLAIDTSGNVYLTGSSVDSNGNSDYNTIKYDAAGAELWMKRYNGPGNSYDRANSLAVDAFGNVYVTGTTFGGYYQDYATVKYNAAGTELWVKQYDGPANSDDLATSLAVDNFGNVYVTGGSTRNGRNMDYATVKYSQSQTQFASISSFILMNADTDADIIELKDGDIINVMELGFPRLTMRVNTIPDVVGSVVLRLSGPLSRGHVENFVPYTLFGDDGKHNYYGVAFPAGNYTLTATPYSASQSKGTKGTPLTVRFAVTGTGTAVNSLILVNSETDTDIKTLKDGDVIDLATLPTSNLNIRAVTNPETVGSVVFNLDNQVVAQENQAPYAIGGDSYGNYRPWTLPVGQHTLTATPYSAKQGAGEKGKAHSVSFTVVNGSPTTQARAATPKKLLTDGQISGERLQAIPNPFADQTNITFSVPKSGHTLLEVYDMKGVMVERLYEAQAEAGKIYRVTFDSKQLAAGLYMVTLTSGKEVQSYKLVLIR